MLSVAFLFFFDASKSGNRLVADTCSRRRRVPFESACWDFLSNTPSRRSVER